jgi:hypothetical protein
MSRRTAIEAELKRLGVRHAQAEQVAFAAARWIKEGAPPEQAALAALYLWGPSNRKRCRALAAEIRSSIRRLEPGEIEPFDAQVMAVLFAHSILVELRIKDPQDALLRAVRSRTHADGRIQEAINAVPVERWYTTAGVAA